MFIRKVLHKNNKTRKEYYTFKLVDSVRTERGPRQRTVLNLGVDFSLPEEQWKDLANCIEEIITGQQNLIEYPKTVRTFARKYSKKIINREAQVLADTEVLSPDYATVDLNSVNNEEARTVGAEYVVYETIKELAIDQKLKEFGLRTDQIAASVGVIAGRMIVPGSERATHFWLQNISALGELMGFDFSLLSLDRLYKAADYLMQHKVAIEDHLCETETRLFALEEKILLYDLTNTFFEGSGKHNPKAQYGRSKEKRTDCPLVTLGLVLDMHGFPKRSRIFEGNVSEPGTLETMIRGLSQNSSCQNSLFKPTIVMDAGIASEDNIQWLRDNQYLYIVVSRKKKKEIPSDIIMMPVKIDVKTKEVLVQAGLAPNKETDELELYCHSVDKEKKEESIKTKFQGRFEAELSKAHNAIHLPSGTKNYEKVIERIGRLKEKFRLVSHRYNITIDKDPESDNAKSVTWSRKKAKKTSGVYCLRTNRNDLNEQQTWDIYTMLTDIEDAFRCMKSELGLRPIYHHIERRCDGHIFITLLAYHVMHTIRCKLREKEIRFCWTTIRTQLSSQVRISTTMKQKDGKAVHLRKSSRAESSHRAIYEALNLSTQPGRLIKTIL
jgi:transposase